jgi:carbon-monoxide dehydrogenase iron sulfur subunit
MGKLIFNYENCTGCRACELACSFHKEGVFAPSKSRIKVVRIDEEGIDIPIGCEQCDDAPCITICPTKALSRDLETDAVLLNMDKCIGCKQCMVVCPFGAISYNKIKKTFYKCDLCDGDPECVKWCLTGAIEYHEDIKEFPKRKTVARVKHFLRNIPKPAEPLTVEGGSGK